MLGTDSDETDGEASDSRPLDVACASPLLRRSPGAGQKAPFPATCLRWAGSAIARPNQIDPGEPMSNGATAPSSLSSAGIR
jgi:hypothetical protein